MHQIRRIVLLITVLSLSHFATDSVAEPASGVVTSFQSGLVEVMKNAEKLGVSGRYERLKPLIERSFNLPLMAGLAAGPHWATASDKQRARMIEAFTRMSAATLATLFDGYSGESFHLVGEREGPQGITFVDTVLKVPGRQDDVQLSYVTRPSGTRWYMIDVIVDGGISELKVRISEYNQTLKSGGIEALIALLNGKADELLS